MKKILLVGILLVGTLVLASCSDSSAPLTEAQQAEKYNMTQEEFQETKAAAARMNMTIEDHMKMTDTSEEMNHDMMDTSDDSSMIEDDAEMMNDDTMHMETMHAGEDIEKHGADEHGKQN